MSLFICEGVKVRIDDPWSDENNGKEFYLDLNQFDGGIPKMPEKLESQDLGQFSMLFQINDGKDYSGKVKDSIIEASLQILEKQREQGTKPKGRTFELVSEMTGITRAYARKYCESKKHGNTAKLENTDNQRILAMRELKKIRYHLQYLIDNLDEYDWPAIIKSLSKERVLAEEVIRKLQEIIIEGDESMKKISVDYQLEDCQCDYLSRIHRNFPHITEEDLFLIIMIEGSSLDITQKMRDFCKVHNISNCCSYTA